MMGNTSILVVEDEIIIANDLRARLIDMGYFVCGLVVSGDMVLDKAREEKPDLILMDIQLQGNMDGIQAATKVHYELDIPVLFLTAHCNDEVLRRARVAEPYGYVIKPINDRELRANIEMAVYKANAEKERRRLVEERREALRQVKILSGMLPICASCKKIRDDQGYWQQVEKFFQEHADVVFSHSLCPHCAKKLYPDLYDE